MKTGKLLEVLNDAIEKSGISVTELARRINVSGVGLHKNLNADSKMSVDTLLAILQALGFNSMWDLLGKELKENYEVERLGKHVVVYEDKTAIAFGMIGKNGSSLYTAYDKLNKDELINIIGELNEPIKFERNASLVKTAVELVKSNFTPAS